MWYAWIAMTNDILKYVPEMDKELAEIVETLRKCKVIRVTKFAKGSMNHVFKVETERETIVARIFAKKRFPGLQEASLDPQNTAQEKY